MIGILNDTTWAMTRIDAETIAVLCGITAYRLTLSDAGWTADRHGLGGWVPIEGIWDTPERAGHGLVQHVEGVN